MKFLGLLCALLLIFGLVNAQDENILDSDGKCTAIGSGKVDCNTCRCFKVDELPACTRMKCQPPPF